MGVLRKDGLIESKWEECEPHVYLSLAQDMPSRYGERIKFWRPCEVDPDFKQKLSDVAKKALEDAGFSVPAKRIHIEP